MKTSTVIRFVIILVASFGSAHCNLLQANERETISKFMRNLIRNPHLKPNDPVLDMTTPEIIRAAGYTVESHVVITEDGYMITMFRIPGPPNSPVVFLQHGFLGDSASWVLTGKNNGLPFLLADQGYDVWLGNARGTKYSITNINYPNNVLKFWDFSWNEMGIYDLPAEISYITQLKKEKIIYIGHSMGTTMFYVKASEKSEVAANIKAMFSLAPVAFVTHVKSPARILVPIRQEMKLLVDLLNHGEIQGPDSLMTFLANTICDNPITEDIPKKSQIFPLKNFLKNY